MTRNQIDPPGFYDEENISIRNRTRTKAAPPAVARQKYLSLPVV